LTGARLTAAIAALAFAGAAVAGYLTYTHYAHVSIVCATGGCETVQQSRYAELAGEPVALLGLVAYLAILVTAVVPRLWAAAAGAVTALSGASFAAYLFAVQLFVIDAICQWCVTSDAIMLALAVLTVVRLRPLVS
jgi:uncharacterized membrane protein